MVGIEYLWGRPSHLEIHVPVQTVQKSQDYANFWDPKRQQQAPQDQKPEIRWKKCFM